MFSDLPAGGPGRLLSGVGVPPDENNRPKKGEKVIKKIELAVPKKNELFCQWIKKILTQFSLCRNFWFVKIIISFFR